MGLIEILQLILGSSGLLGIAFLIFRIGRIVEKVDVLERCVTQLEINTKTSISGVYAEIKEFRKEVKEEIDCFKKDLKSEISAEIKEFRKEVKEEIDCFKKDLKSEISSVGGEVLMLREDIKRMHVDVSDVKERVAFMEAFIFFSEFTAESNNSRSESAKKMWERRKMKKVESKK